MSRFMIMAGRAVKKGYQMPKMRRRTRTIVESRTGELIGTPYIPTKRTRRPIGGRSYRREAVREAYKGPKTYVQPPRTKSKLTLSKKQFLRLLERNIGKERSQRNIASKYQPQQEVPYTRLYEPRSEAQTGLTKSPVDMQYGLGQVAAARSEAGIGPRMIPEQGRIPPADVLTYQGGQPRYERRVFSPVRQTPKRAAMGATEHAREAAQQDVTSTVRKRLGKHKRSISAAQRSKTLEATPSEKLVQDALILDNMWKAIGGGRSADGHKWRRLMQSSRGRRKPTDARDYFIRVGLKWMENPEATARTYPREVKELETAWQMIREVIR